MSEDSLQEYVLSCAHRGPEDGTQEYVLSIYHMGPEDGTRVRPASTSPCQASSPAHTVETLHWQKLLDLVAPLAV